MFSKPRRNAVAAAALLLVAVFAPLAATPAAAAVGVRANAGSSQIIELGDAAFLDGSRSYTLSGGNLSYKWDFNQSDGIQEDATGVLASHTYNATGIYTVTLVVTDGAQSDSDETTVVVSDNTGNVPGVPNLPPVAVPPRNQLGRQNTSMVFDGTRSFDPNGDNLSFEWDFNELDGLTPGGDAQGAVVNHTYGGAGVFNVTLIVSDGNASDSGRTSAIIIPDNGTVIPGVNVPPVAVIDGTRVGQVNTVFEFNANRSFDADGDSMRLTWDFDSSDGRTTDVNAEGTVVWHTFTETGLYNVTLTATDAQGQDTDTLRVIVTNEVGGVPGVSNLPPFAIITSPVPGSRHDLNAAVHFDGTQSFDVDGDIVACQWSDISRGPADSPFSSACETNFSFAEGGLKEVLFLVEDDAGSIGGNQVTFWVNDTSSGPLNRQPDGEIEGNATPVEDTPVNFTANMTDPDGDQMNYTWDFDLSDGLSDSDATGRNVTHSFPDPGRVTIAVSVLDGNHRNVPVIRTLNIQVSERPTYAPEAFAGNDTSTQAGNGLVFDCRGTDTDGNITLYEWDFEGDGVFDYRSPDSGFTIFAYPREGNYTAVCRVTDNDGLTGTDGRRVDVRPAPNDPPVADAGPDKPNETQGLQTFFHGTGTDTDGNISLYEWDFEGDGVYDYIDGTSGDTFHVYGDAGTYVAVLRVTDNRNARGTDTSTVSVKRNQPPAANAGVDQSVAAGEQVSFSGAASRDPEGAIAKFSWDFDSSDGIQEDFTGVAPAHTYDRGGSYLVTLTVYDSLGQSATDTMFVDVTQTGGVALSVDNDGTLEVAPDQSSSYLLVVTNTGDGTDTISLSLDGDPEVVAWYTLEVRQVANLEAAGVRIVRLTVQVPRGALVDQASEVTVRASSGADPGKTAQVFVLTAVKEVVRLELTFSSFPSSIKPGETVEVTVHIVNSGNRDIKVSFAELAGDSVWLTLKSPLVPFTIRAGRSQDFAFDLLVPPGTAGGAKTLTLTAKVALSTVTDTESVPLTVDAGFSFIPSLAAPGLMVGIVVAAGLVLVMRPPRRREGQPGP
jgi:PKD repeat protein